MKISSHNTFSLLAFSKIGCTAVRTTFFQSNELPLFYHNIPGKCKFRKFFPFHMSRLIEKEKPQHMNHTKYVVAFLFGNQSGSILRSRHSLFGLSYCLIACPTTVDVQDFPVHIAGIIGSQKQGCVRNLFG